MKIRKIKWTIEQKGQIENIYGKVNGLLIFTIVRFRKDPYIMTSRYVPMEMIKSDKLLTLKKEASKKLKSFVLFLNK